MCLGSQNLVFAPFPYDIGLGVAVGICLDVASEFYLPDKRAIRVNIADPILAQSTMLDNPCLIQYTPVVPFGQVTLSMSIPPIPVLTGLGAYFIGVTASPNSPGSI